MVRYCSGTGPVQGENDKVLVLLLELNRTSFSGSGTGARGGRGYRINGVGSKGVPRSVLVLDRAGKKDA